MKKLFLVLLTAFTTNAHAADGTPDPAGPPAPAINAVPPPPMPASHREEIPPPEITPGPALPLSQALTRAAERNLDLAVAKMEVVKARAKLSSAWGLVHPIVQGKMEYTHMDHEDTVDLASSFSPLLQTMGITLPPGTDLGDPLLTNPREKLTGGIDAMVPLLNANSWLSIRAAKKGVEVAELSIEQAKRQILLGVAQAYFMSLTARDLIDFYHAQIVTTTEQLRIAKARFNAGRGMRIDVIRAETDAEQATQSLRSALLAFDNARDALGNLVGADGLPFPAPAPELRGPEGSIAQMEEDALGARVDVKTEAAKIELMDHQLAATWLKFVPSLSLAGHGGYQFTEMADLGSTDRSRWAVMLSLTVPIYDYFRYADLDDKRAQLRQAKLSLENTERKATLAVRKAHRDYTNALINVVTAKKQADLAGEGLKLVEAAYRAGTASSLEVTQARQTHTAAGFNLATSELKAQLALITLLDAVGNDLPGSIHEISPEPPLE